MKRIALIFVFLSFLLYPFSVYSQDNKSKKEPVTVEEAVVPEMNVVNNKLYVKNASGKRVDIFTIIGNKVRDIQITSSDFEYDLNLPRAIYIFKMDGMVKKFIIK